MKIVGRNWGRNWDATGTQLGHNWDATVKRYSVPNGSVSILIHPLASWWTQLGTQLGRNWDATVKGDGVHASHACATPNQKLGCER